MSANLIYLDAIKVKIWGEIAGVLVQHPITNKIVFRYEDKWKEKGLQLAPLTMPTDSNNYYSFDRQLSERTFYGLPGLIADSLPDDFGNSVLKVYLQQIGRESLTPIERLAYLGTRGMGALEFEPHADGIFNKSKKINIDSLVEIAQDILHHRTDFKSNMRSNQLIDDIVVVGTSAGGARAKAVIAYNAESNEVRSGQVEAPIGFKHYIIKLDTDAQGYLKTEYAYYLMAQKSGIHMRTSNLLLNGNHAHFITERFDRGEANEKVHMQTLCAMAHLDFRNIAEYSYEYFLGVARKLNLPYLEQEEIFRRAVFNVFAVNRDDHTKNHAFTMQKNGQWSLSPAYDITYSFDPTSSWVARHALSIHDKRDAITIDDLQQFAKRNGIKKSADIIEQVRIGVGQWQDIAHQCGVEDEKIIKIATIQKIALDGKSLVNRGEKLNFSKIKSNPNTKLKL